MENQLVTIEIPNLAKVEKRLGGLHHKAPSVMSKAINRTVREVSKLMAKEAQKQYWVKAVAAKKTLRIRKSSRSSLSGEVISRSDERIKLHKFRAAPKSPATPTSGGSAAATAQVRKGGGMKPLPGDGDHAAAFVARMKSGHVGIFQRQTDRSGTSKNTDRTRARAQSIFRNMPDNPIAELTGPAIPSMLASKRLSTEVIDRGREFLQKALDEEIARVLEVKA